jgi:hypothetical protein
MNVHNELECALKNLSNLVQCLGVRPGAYPRVEHLKGVSLGSGTNTETLDWAEKTCLGQKH